MAFESIPLHWRVCCEPDFSPWRTIIGRLLHHVSAGKLGDLGSFRAYRGTPAVHMF